MDQKFQYIEGVEKKYGGISNPFKYIFAIPYSTITSENAFSLGRRRVVFDQVHH